MLHESVCFVHLPSYPRRLLLIPCRYASKFTAIGTNVFLLPEIEMLFAFAEQTLDMLVAAVRAS
jgi:hypothetical protein